MPVLSFHEACSVSMNMEVSKDVCFLDFTSLSISNRFSYIVAGNNLSGGEAISVPMLD